MKLIVEGRRGGRVITSKNVNPFLRGLQYKIYNLTVQNFKYRAKFLRIKLISGRKGGGDYFKKCNPLSTRINCKS